MKSGLPRISRRSTDRRDLMDCREQLATREMELLKSVCRAYHNADWIQLSNSKALARAR